MRPLATSLAVLACLTALLPPHTAGAEQADKKKDAVPKPHKPKFTISKETTYVTGPLDKDGYIDYAAALNKRLSQGVTPANNANVLLWQALGPQPDGRKLPGEFFELMGMKPPSERGEYFVDLYYYIRKHARVDDYEERKELLNQLDRARERPWNPQQYPHIAAWLKVNEKPMALVLDATKRPAYFSPFVPSKSDQGSSGLLGAFIPPGIQKCREMCMP